MGRWSWDTQVGPVASRESFREPVLAIPRGRWDHESRVGVMCCHYFEDGEGAMNQGMCQGPPEAGKGQKTDPPLEPPGGTSTADNLLPAQSHPRRTSNRQNFVITHFLCS